MTTSTTATGTRRLQAGFLGRVGYSEAASLQEETRHRLENGTGDEHLLLLEHPHVFTLGRNADRSDLLATDEWLSKHQVEVVESDRGGQMTYHGPGQLVGYPILDLNPDRRNIRRYVCDLQEVLIRTLADFGIQAEAGLPDRPAGVWVGAAKIGSIGVHLRRWLTTHGFALNVSTDLHFFDGIITCGMQDVRVTSMKQLGVEGADPESVADHCLEAFCDVFERTATALPRDVLRRADRAAS